LAFALPTSATSRRFRRNFRSLPPLPCVVGCPEQAGFGHSYTRLAWVPLRWVGSFPLGQSSYICLLLIVNRAELI
ncbi:hypothetical protein WG66_012636, partial [Moniliophthora roreri]